ncbi:MAG TPA: T9SS type A sorting domain-containing protein [Cyclobacteriaceae bacterium]|nr:T9SS type A sorting domain-containing protein [Cyclobacteriaceae bacterium]
MKILIVDMGLQSVRSRAPILLFYLILFSQQTWAQWVERNNGLYFGGTIQDIAVYGLSRYVATDGAGVYKSVNNGATWVEANSGLTHLNVKSVVISGGSIYAGTSGGGVFLSNDNGSTWVPVNNGLANLYINSLFIYGSTILAGTGGGGIFLSTDGGDNWIEGNLGLTNNFVTSFSSNGFGIFAGTGQGIFVSVDYGVSWTQVNNGLTNLYVSSLATSGGYIFAGTNGGGVFESTDNGANWNIVNGGLTNLSVYKLAINSSGKIFAGTFGGGVFLSTDNGAIWNQVNNGLNPNVSSLAIINSSSVMAGTFGAGVFLSTDNGTNWSETNYGIRNINIRAVVKNGSDFFAGTQAGGIYLSQDGGDTWTAKNNGLTDSFVYTIVINGTNIFAGTGSSGVFISTDYGDSWTAKNNGLTNLSILCLALNGGTLLAGTSGGGIFTSTDNGANWNPINNGITNLTIRKIVVNGVDIFVATHAGGVFHSNNNGLSWTAVNNGLPSLSIRSLVFKGTDLFAGTVNFGVFKSSNKGGSWAAVNSGLNTSAFLYGLEASGSNLFAGGAYGGDGNIYQSKDNGVNWIEIGDNLLHPDVNDFETNGNILYAATAGRGIWAKVFDPAAQPTSLTFSNVKATSLTGNFVAATDNPDGYLVLFSANASPNFIPVDGVEYSYHEEVGTVSGNKIYNVGQGNSTSFNLVDLSPGETLYFKIYPYNGSGSLIKYLTSAPLEANITTPTDVTPPEVVSNATPTKIAPNIDIPLSANFVDVGSGITSAKIYYRPIAGISPNNFIEATLTPPSSGSTFTGLIPASAVTELGVEYKFFLTDVAGNDNSSNQTLYTTRILFEQSTSQTLIIPYTDPGIEQSNYRIIAFPIDLDSKSVNNVFNDTFGPYDPTQYTLYRWEGGPNYVELSGNSQFELGKGYWYLTPISTPVPIGSGTTADVTTNSPFKMTLKPGWNQIGNPYNFDISWMDILNANPANVANLGSNSKVRVFRGVVSDVDELQKFEGGFVKNTSTSDILINIPVAKNGSINGRKRQTDERLINSLDKPDWEIMFKLSSDKIEYDLGGLGMNTEASLGFDSYDDFNMPRFFEYLELKYPKERVGMTYTKDVVPPSENYVWTFNVESNIKSKNISIQWDNSYFRTRKEIYLLDVMEHRIINMSEQNYYSFSFSPSREFKVVYGNHDFVTNELVPNRLVLHDPYPNPFNESISIEYAIPRDFSQHAEIQIYNILGEKVFSTIIKEIEGIGKQTWDASKFSTGLYIVKLKYGNQVETKKLLKR